MLLGNKYLRMEWCFSWNGANFYTMHFYWNYLHFKWLWIQLFGFIFDESRVMHANMFFKRIHIFRINVNLKKKSQEIKLIFYKKYFTERSKGGGTSYCMCGNTLKTATKYLERCTQSCSGDSAECCGDISSRYYSVYFNSKLINFY